MTFGIRCRPMTTDCESHKVEEVDEPPIQTCLPPKSVTFH